MFSSIVSSPRASLSPKQALDIARVYMENANNAADPEIALVFCHDTEVSLAQAKKTIKHAKDHTVLADIITAYVDLGKLLERRKHSVPAQASYKKARKLGWDGQDQHQVAKPSQSTSITVSGHIFAEMLHLPTTNLRLPEPDERLDSTHQLACCLALLQLSSSPDDIVDPAAQKWLKDIANDSEEQERLYGVATEIVRAFKGDILKDAKAVAEVVSLAPILNKDLFHDLLAELYLGNKNTDLLNFNQLEGLALVIQGADSGYLSADDLVKILTLLSTRLMGTHRQSTENVHQLTLAVSHVLDAMADTKVTGLDREKLHEPLSSFLSRLRESKDPYLVYQAGYAYQALLCVPDNETTWQAAMRRTKKVVQGVSGLVSAVKGLDLNKLIEGLGDIQQGFEGALKVIEVAKNAYQDVAALAKNGKDFCDCLQEGLSFERKREWYSALRGADVLIQDGELATFKVLVCEAPCRLDPAFQWGICQRLWNIAANPRWDTVTRRNAIEFLADIYQRDEVWGQQAAVKQWVLNILMQLASSSGNGASIHAIAAERILDELSKSGDDKKRAFYQSCRESGPITYPLRISQQEVGFPSLLDRVQSRPDVEGSLRIMRKQRTKGRVNTVYIQPQAKPSIHAAEDSRFSLTDRMTEFLGSDQKVFLLLGDSGSGKSTFTHELEQQLWKSYMKMTGRIPLHINLPTIDKPEHDMIAKQLRKCEFSEPQIREMKHHRKFILICDGYDESQQTHNLYVSNRISQPGEWDAQVVISCRTEYLGADYRDRFQPTDRNHQPDTSLYQEAVITPFSLNQVHSYIDQYVSLNQPLWRADDYKRALDLIPSLKELVRNPFLMALSLEVLPRIVDLGQNQSFTRVTRVTLYDHFMEQWLERGKKRIGEKDLGRRGREEFERLSAEGFTTNGIGYLKKLASAIYKEQDGHPVVEYSESVDEGTWKDAFFRFRHKQLLHEASPLTRNGNQHRFIHRSLLEYSLARAVFDPHDRRNMSASGPTMGRRGSSSSILSIEKEDTSEGQSTDTIRIPDVDSPLVWRSFVNDHSILQFLEERVQQEAVFKQQLFDFIELSKTDKKWHKAASNAITILVRAGVQFIGSDLRGIRIPRADLSYGVFDSVQLQDADLRKVNLRGVWLRQTDLSRAQMAGVQFGELPSLAVTAIAQSCTYSPDGQILAVGLDDGDINLYSTSNWEQSLTLDGHSEDVVSVAYSPKGDMIASASYDVTVRIWDLATGECRHVFCAHDDEVNSVQFSPGGHQIVSGSDDTTLRIWDVDSGDCLQTLNGHTDLVLCVAYSPEGYQIASGSVDRTVRLWNAETGSCSQVMLGHGGNVTTITYSPHGNQLASGSWDNTIRLWDPDTGSCLHILSEHADGVNSIVYSPKGDYLVSGSRDVTLRLWDAETGLCLHTFTGHEDLVTAVSYSPKGNQVASVSPDTTVRLWDISASASRHVSSGHSAGVYDIDSSPNGVWIASGSKDSTIRLWDAATGSMGRVLIGHDNTILGVAFSPEGDQIASGSMDYSVRLWDMESGSCRLTLTGHSDEVSGVVFSPRGGMVASSSSDNTVRLWDLPSGDCSKVLISHTRDVISIAFSPDGNNIASGSADNTIRIWDIESDSCQQPFEGHDDYIREVNYSPLGDQLASASDDNTVRLWDVRTGECRMILIGHTNWVKCVAFTPSGDLLASGSKDKTVRLWNVATGQCQGTIQNFNGSINRIVWRPSSDINYLITGCEDGSVLKWQVTQGEDHCRVELVWSATSGALYTTGASIQDVQGLTPVNTQLLKQRGAIGEPIPLLHKAAKNVINMASVISRLRQLSMKAKPESSAANNAPNNDLEEAENVGDQRGRIRSDQGQQIPTENQGQSVEAIDQGEHGYPEGQEQRRDERTQDQEQFEQAKEMSKQKQPELPETPEQQGQEEDGGWTKETRGQEQRQQLGHFENERQDSTMDHDQTA